MPKLKRNIDMVSDLELLSVPEVCKMLGIGRYELYSMFDNGLKFVFVGTQKRTNKLFIKNYLENY